ncbi:MAG: ribosomal RNA large subunit methyltransferase E [Gammaproteobacteria bacterium]|nr:MAG: ribosomal RNA large subunit methyltransferase E [Gammaproteobacteria bacterium]
MARSAGSKRWLAEHRRDRFVQQARREGYRSRAVYKLAEIDRRRKLLRPGACVVDLGAAPGGWSQYAAERVGARGRVVACDRLPMTPPAGVTFIQGDFQEEAVLAAVLEALAGRPVDVVLSDMAPDLSGVAAVDIPRALHLVELAHDLARRVLRPGGAFLCKLFQGSGSDAFLAALRADFASVRVLKPEASRDRSREVYVLAEGRRGGN